MQLHFPLEERYPFFNKRALDIDDLEYICERESITLSVRKLNCHGLYVRVHDVPTIFIDESLTPNQRVFALLHELGHHFLHPNLSKNYLKDSFFPYVEIEQQANDVALVGVAPDPLLEPIHRQHRLSPGQLMRRFPVFAEINRMSANTTLQPLHFLRRRIELFHERRAEPGLDFLGLLQQRAKRLATRHRKCIAAEHVQRGLSEVEAVLRWGEPQKVLTRGRKGASVSKWLYTKLDDTGAPVAQRLFFRNGSLVGARL
ncbi:MAG: ImmA/IrrE family metallo-endopeptidase [bacterium]